MPFAYPNLVVGTCLTGSDPENEKKYCSEIRRDFNADYTVTHA